MFDLSTQVLNSQAFNHLVDKEIKKAERYQYFLSMLTIQLDKMNHVDDSTKQDTMMGSVAGLLKEEIRATDIIGRLDQERFGIALLHADSDDTVKVGERIRQLIENYMFNQASQGNLTISVGAACFPTHVGDTDSLLQSSEKMLFLAKEKGGNCILMPE